VTADTDPHSDHQAAAALVRDATWPRGVQVAHYPVWTWQAAPASLPTHTPKGYRVDVQEHLASKRLAIGAHRSQHGLVITDAVEAFALPPAFVERFVACAEALVWPA
jgi:LmbE family N-acetylglucosaminyl deacetylase